MDKDVLGMFRDLRAFNMPGWQAAYEAVDAVSYTCHLEAKDIPVRVTTLVPEEMWMYSEGTFLLKEEAPQVPP